MFALLKAKGWATQLSTGEAGSSFTAKSFFNVTVVLTKEGECSQSCADVRLLLVQVDLGQVQTSCTSLPDFKHFSYFMSAIVQQAVGSNLSYNLTVDSC